MQLKLIKNKNVKYFRAYIDEVYIGPVYYADLKKAEIDIDFPGDEPDGNDQNILKEISETFSDRLYSVIYSKAFDKYSAFLAGAEYSAYDIKLKMKRNNYSDEIINDVIEALYAERYLDDKRYAESYIRYYSRTKSRELIIRELEYKGVTGDWMNDLLNEVYTDESIERDEVIKNLIEKKYKGQDLSDEKVKRRVAAFLLRKGFSFSDINSYLT